MKNTGCIERQIQHEAKPSAAFVLRYPIIQHKGEIHVVIKTNFGTCGREVHFLVLGNLSLPWNSVFFRHYYIFNSTLTRIYSYIVIRAVRL